MLMRLIRFGISIPENLSKKFDQFIRNKKYSNRSEAIRDLIRKALVQEEVEQNAEVVRLSVCCTTITNANSVSV